MQPWQGLAPSPVSRRAFIRNLGQAAGIVCAAPWLAEIALAANHTSKKSVILLWLNGGPATIDLWDCKPASENGGPVTEIATATPGLRISEYLPQVAKWTEEMILIRSMTSREGDHSRAAHLVRTGYVPQASIDFPDMGAVFANEAGEPDAGLPSFVSIAPPSRTAFKGAGFLGPKASPLTIGGPNQESEGLRIPYLFPTDDISDARQMGRTSLLNILNTGHSSSSDEPIVDSFKTATRRALQLMNPRIAKTFDLSQETDRVRESYGRSVFGQGCLIARRLIEKQVPFVELTLDGWDTHQDNFNRVRVLAEQLDRGYSQLLGDLADRGLLDSTLIVCAGEFGRTPRINNSTGRDHWPNSWAVSLAGGGVNGGQAIGHTSADGTKIEGDSCTAGDLIATLATAVGIDPRKQNDSNVGRPIRVADPDGKVIEGVLS